MYEQPRLFKLIFAILLRVEDIQPTLTARDLSFKPPPAQPEPGKLPFYKKCDPYFLHLSAAAYSAPQQSWTKTQHEVVNYTCKPTETERKRSASPEKRAPGNLHKKRM